MFLRHLISKSPMGKFLCKSQWIRLLLSFLSVKPCDDVKIFLNMQAEDMIDPKKEGKAGKMSEMGIQMCRDILFTPGLRPRLLAIQLLEYILNYISKSESDLQELVRLLD